MTDHQTDTDAVIDLARSETLATMAGPAAIDPAELHSIVLPSDLRHEIIDLEKHLPGPRRTRGTVNIHDATSLVAYVKKHAEGTHTALYADIDTSTVTAVLNGHAKSEHPDSEHTGWGDHRAILKARVTPEWSYWAHKNQTWLSQSAFAEHIEAGQAEIIDPAAGEMLDLAQTLQATVGVAFKQQTMLANGQRQFKYEETVAATAGAQGTMKIPGQFTLAVRVYDTEGDFYKILARLQFRIEDRALKMRYLLDRPHDILRSAFDDVVTTVEAGAAIVAYRAAAPPALQ